MIKAEKQTKAQQMLAAAIALLPKIEKLIAEVSEDIIGRAELIRFIWLGMVTGHTAFTVGHYGVAKTHTIRAITDRIEGGSFFEKVVPTLMSLAEVVVGKKRILQKETEEGTEIEVRESPGRGAHATVRYWNEFFLKPDNPVLGELVTLVLDKKFSLNGGEDFQSETLFDFADGNNLPDLKQKVNGPIFARMLLRLHTKPLTPDQRRAASIRVNQIQYDAALGVLPKPKTLLTLDEVRQFRLAHQLVEIPSSLIDKVEEMFGKLLSTPNVDFTNVLWQDRRSILAYDVIQAHALLNGRTVAQTEDLAVLQYVWWDTFEQLAVLEALIAEYVRTPLVEAQELYNRLLGSPDVVAARQSGGNSSARAMRALSEAHTEVERLKAGCGNDPAMQSQIADVLEDLVAVREEIKHKFASI